MLYEANQSRYETMRYNYTGASGLQLGAISLGLWQNFGQSGDQGQKKRILLEAFDLGVTHFDLANNYGPPAGSAEEFMGQMLSEELGGYRDELIISTKAGYDMWPGPYGRGGSRKYLLASLDQSLKRMKLDYVDIFYSHRYDAETPLDETMGALEHAQRQGKALYVGISNYDHVQTEQAAKLLAGLGTRCSIHQPSYSMLNRWIEPELLATLKEYQIGCIAFCPLAQGLLTDKYLRGIPAGSRAAEQESLRGRLTPELVEKLGRLNQIAARRGQSLAQMALVWTLRDPAVTSALIGASSVEHIRQNVQALENPSFGADELTEIEDVLNS